jgi:hypothetical protein
MRIIAVPDHLDSPTLTWTATSDVVVTCDPARQDDVDGFRFTLTWFVPDPVGGE